MLKTLRTIAQDLELNLTKRKPKITKEKLQKIQQDLAQEAKEKNLFVRQRY